MAKIDWRDGLLLEQEISKIIYEQQEYGLFFDLDKAYTLIEDLHNKKDTLYKEIRSFLTYDIVCKETTNSVAKEYSVDNYNSYFLDKGEKQFVKRLKTKDGGNTASVANWLLDGSVDVLGPFSRISIEEPQISKRQLIIKQLLKHGWKPKEFTDKGQPKITISGEPVSTLKSVGSFGQSLADWYTYNHRQSQITGFIPHVRADGRIAAQCNPCGTNTFRAKHRVVANIPRPTSTYGPEMRSLFGVEPGRVFVGADVSGLELRMLCHHMKDPEYIKQVLHGDIHTYNMEMAGLSTRDQAKTFIYGFLYGAGAGKIGEIVDGTSRDGSHLKQTFLDSLPKLDNLITKVSNFSNRGWLPSIDGRKIWIRSNEGKILTHTALNALLQANGSIVTKRAMLISYQEIKKRGLDAHQIIFYHDEYAYDCSKEVADEVADIAVDSMRKAGEYYNLILPITGESGIGTNWGVH